MIGDHTVKMKGKEEERIETSKRTKVGERSGNREEEGRKERMTTEEEVDRWDERVEKKNLPCLYQLRLEMERRKAKSEGIRGETDVRRRLEVLG